MSRRVPLVRSGFLALVQAANASDGPRHPRTQLRPRRRHEYSPLTRSLARLHPVFHPVFIARFCVSLFDFDRSYEGD
jgi:hypothetical protein